MNLGSFFHVTPQDRGGRSIAGKIFESIGDTLLEGKLKVLGSAGTAVMTGS